eukprot:3506-Chlamydomonas_euryale.AAC.7
MQCRATGLVNHAGVLAASCAACSHLQAALLRPIAQQVSVAANAQSSGDELRGETSKARVDGACARAMCDAQAVCLIGSVPHLANAGVPMAERAVFGYVAPRGSESQSRGSESCDHRLRRQSSSLPSSFAMASSAVAAAEAAPDRRREVAGMPTAARLRMASTTMGLSVLALRTSDS